MRKTDCVPSLKLQCVLFLSLEKKKRICDQNNRVQIKNEWNQNLKKRFKEIPHDKALRVKFLKIKENLVISQNLWQQQKKKKSGIFFFLRTYTNSKNFLQEKEQFQGLGSIP